MNILRVVGTTLTVMSVVLSFGIVVAFAYVAGFDEGNRYSDDVESVFECEELEA